MMKVNIMMKDDNDGDSEDDVHDGDEYNDESEDNYENVGYDDDTDIIFSTASL